MYRPRFQITPHFLRLTVQATELRAWIENAVVDVAWLPALQRETTARLAHSSTAIEGNPLTLPEVEALARDPETGSPTKAQQEVLDYLAGMRWLWKRKAGLALQEKDILVLHGLLTGKTLPKQQAGKYKTRPNRVIDSRGVPVYRPPGPEQASPMTRELLTWIGGPESKKLHPINTARDRPIASMKFRLSGIMGPCLRRAHRRRFRPNHFLDRQPAGGKKGLKPHADQLSHSSCAFAPHPGSNAPPP